MLLIVQHTLKPSDTLYPLLFFGSVQTRKRAKHNMNGTSQGHMLIPAQAGEQRFLVQAIYGHIAYKFYNQKTGLIFGALAWPVFLQDKVFNFIVGGVYLQFLRGDSCVLLQHSF